MRFAIIITLPEKISHFFLFSVALCYNDINNQLDATITVY